MTAAKAAPERTMPEPIFWDRRQVEARTSLSRSMIYRRMARGEFPRPVDLGGKCVRWRIADVERWLAERPEAGPEAVADA